MRAGSLLVTIMGDALAPRGAAITLTSLIRLMEPFGVTDRLVRTTVGRQAHSWLVSSRQGSFSQYALSPSALALYAVNTERIYGAETIKWNGQWTLVMFQEFPGDLRQRVRDDMDGAGFGETMPGVFMHPNYSPAAVRDLIAPIGLADKATILQTQPCDSETNADIVRSGWDLADLNVRYRRFIQQFQSVADVLADGADPSPESAFVLRTLLIHEYRRIHLRDPMLPVALLPDNWAGITAHELCRSVYISAFSRAEEHLISVATRLDGPLPKASPETYARFGGLPRTE